MATIGERLLGVKDAVSCQSDMLRVIKNGMTRLGIANPQVGPTTEFFLITRALANELTAAGYNAILSNDAQMPDTAQGDDMVRVAAIVNKAPQAAAPSVGPVILDSSADAPIPLGAKLTDSLGQTFVVVGGAGVRPPGSIITIEGDRGSGSVGSSTNRAEGDVLQWSDSIPYANSQVKVGAGGLINGVDADTTEVLRGRTLEVFQVPATGENWSDVVEQAEKSTSSVSKAFAYPAVQGPSTWDIAVVAAPTETSNSRVVSPTIMTSDVRPFVTGKVSPGSFGTITSVEDVPVDVAFGINMPDAGTASPPGPGGGWLDGSPWPRPDGVSTFKCSVTTATSTTVLTVDAATAPQDQVSRVMWVSTVDWKVCEATVLTHTGTTGAYVITLDKPLPNIAAGALIWPACENAQVIADSLREAFAEMGPGEKTTNVSALVRGFRHPAPSISWAASLGAHLTHAIEANDNVVSAQFLYRFDSQAAVTLNGSVGLLVPTVPAAYAAPRQFILRNAAFYRAS